MSSTLVRSRIAGLPAAALVLLAVLPAACATPSPVPTVTPSGPLALDPAAPDLPERALSLGQCATAVTGVAWSPDGARIAMGGPNVVVLRDGTTGRQLAMLTAAMEDVTALAWSPDGTLVATGSSNGTVVVWSAGE